MCGTAKGGQYKKRRMAQNLRAQRGRAPGALNWRVAINSTCRKVFLVSIMDFRQLLRCEDGADPDPSQEIRA